jgi:PAS domain-containing protein
MVVVAAPDMQIVYANRAAHRAAGSAPGALVGRVAAEAFAFVDSVLLDTEPQTRARCVAGPAGGATIWWDVSSLS